MKKIIAFTFTILSSAWLMAQEDTTVYEYQEVVIQRKQLEKVQRLTRNVDIITAQEIKTLPVKSVNELLSFVGGVDVRQRGPFGSQADVSIDGGSFEQTLVLINGVKMLDAQTAHNMMNIPIPLEAIKRIEILKGPAAWIYGVNALTGAINIITKTEEKSGVSVNTYAGSSFQDKAIGEGDGIYGGGGLQVTGNFSTKKQNHLVAISQDLYNGQRYNTAQNNTKFFYTGNHQFDKKNKLEWMGGYIHNDFGANGFYAAPGDKESNETVETAIFSLSSSHQLGRFTISPSVSNRYNEDDYRYLGKSTDVAQSMHYANAFTTALNTKVKTTIGDFGLAWESRFDEINSSNIGQHQRNNHGFSTEYKNVFWRKLITTAGAYANYNTHYGWQVYPGLDLAYRFSTHWMISASAGSGQRIPSFTDLYLNQKPANVGNPNIQPENAWAYEANLQYSKKGIKIKGGYFYRSITDYIDWVRENPSLPYSPINIGENLVHGVYGHIRHNFELKNKSHLGYNISYNYLQPSYQSKPDLQSKYILESLRHQLIVGLYYIYNDFSIQINNRFIERELNTPYHLLSVRLNYEIKDFSIYADASNLLDEKYVEAGAVPMPPRWFTLGFRYIWKQK